MTLENDKDLEKAKREHAVKGEVKNLKLTVCMIQTEIGGKGQVANRSMKRRLDLQAPSSSVKPETMRSKSSEDSESGDDDRFMMYLKNEASKPDQKRRTATVNRMVRTLVFRFLSDLQPFSPIILTSTSV